MSTHGTERHHPGRYRGVRQGRLEQGSGRRIVLRASDNGDFWPIDQVSFLTPWGGNTEGLSKLPRPWQFGPKGGVEVEGDLVLFDAVASRGVIILGCIVQTRSTDDLVGRVLEDEPDADPLHLKVTPADGGEARLSIAHESATAGKKEMGVMDLSATHRLRLLLAANLDQLATALRVELQGSVAKVQTTGPTYPLVVSTMLTSLALGLTEVVAFMAAFGVPAVQLSAFVTEAQLPNETNTFLTKKLESQ